MEKLKIGLAVLSALCLLALVWAVDARAGSKTQDEQSQSSPATRDRNTVMHDLGYMTGKIIEGDAGWQRHYVYAKILYEDDKIIIRRAYDRHGREYTIVTHKK